MYCASSTLALSNAVVKAVVGLRIVALTTQAFVKELRRTVRARHFGFEDSTWIILYF